MHFILRGLSGIYGGTDTMSKYWLYLVYDIFTGKTNDVDLPEVLCQVFIKFYFKRKPNEIQI